MWYALVILTIASLIWYLSSRRGSITAAQQHHHVSGSGCWELGLFYNRGNRGQDIRTTIQGCKDVLMESWRGEDFAYYGEQMTPLEARAGPNQRLVKGFGIDNAFTTIDEGYHQEFKLKIAKALKTCNQEWLNLWNFSKKATYKSITRQYSDANIRLVPWFKTSSSRLLFRNSSLMIRNSMRTLPLQTSHGSLTRFGWTQSAPVI